jgi:flagellar biosynthesis protein
MSDTAPTPPPPRKAAVALRYERGMDAAPVIVAAGKGLVAEKIEEKARAHGVPVKEEGALAKALVTLKVGEEIPPELYRAVAEVLAFVYKLQADRG